jgi:tRNA dimethylallyltransferase
VVVGGTGLYIDGLYYNFELPELAAETTQQRKALSELTVADLQELIEKQGLQLPENRLNKRHLINTLLRNGVHGTRHEPEPQSVIVGLNPSRELLLERINERTEAMLAKGFFDEVKQLLKSYGEPSREFDALAYRIALRHLHGEITSEETAELMKIADRQYAKRQLSWFRRNKNIVWFNDSSTAYDYVRALFL